MNSIPPEACIFYSPRFENYKKELPRGAKFIHIENIELYNGIFPYPNVLIKQRKKLKKLFSTISLATNNSSFIYYLPHYINHRDQIIGFHKSCLGFYFVEEGMPAYRSNFGKYDNLVKPSWWMNLLLLFTRVKIPKNITPLITNTNKYIGAIGINKKSFIKLQNRKEVEFKYTFNKNHLKTIPSNNCILAVDNVAGIPLLTNTYIECIKQTLTYILSIGYGSIYIKYHPDQKFDSEFKSLVKNICEEKQISYSVLNDDFFIENYVFHYPKTKVFGLLSATLLYADMFGAQVHCFSNLLKHQNIYDPMLFIMEDLREKGILSNRFRFIL